jgi:hypothetical protein
MHNDTTMEQKPTAAFVLSLVAGLWMLGMGGMMYGGMGPGFMTGPGWGHGMMHGIMRTAGPGLWFPWFGPLAGAVVIAGAVILYTRPAQAGTWGLVILLVSAINLFVGMGGFLAGALGVVGGALAMSSKPGPRVG